MSNMTIHGNARFMGGVALVGKGLPANPELGQFAENDQGVPCYYTKINGVETWYPMANQKANHVHTQGVAASEWVVTHGMGSQYFGYFAYDENKQLMIAQVEIIDDDSFKLVFSRAVSGYAMCFFETELYVPNISAGGVTIDSLVATSAIIGGVDMVALSTQNQTNIATLMGIGPGSLAAGVTDAKTYSDANKNTFDPNAAGDLIPDGHLTRDLGSLEKQWRDLFLGPGSLYLNGQKILQDESGTIVMSADANQNIQIRTVGSGDVELVPSGTGIIQVKGALQIAAGKNVTSADGTAIGVSDPLNMNGNPIKNVGAPVDGTDLIRKSDMDASISGLVNGAPETMDTLNELSNALQDNPDVITNLTTAVGGKVDKITGKGLSSNDYSDTDVSKLSGIAELANNYVHPVAHSVSEITGLQSELDSKDTDLGLLMDRITSELNAVAA
jgi:hypothetical protein